MNSLPKKNSPARQVAHIILHNHTCNMYMREKNRKKNTNIEEILAKDTRHTRLFTC